MAAIREVNRSSETASVDGSLGVAAGLDKHLLRVVTSGGSSLTFPIRR